MTHRGALVAVLLVLAGLPALGGVAEAQVSDADKTTARTLAQQGQDALDRKDFVVAAERFGRARQLYPAPTLSLGFARAQVALQHWVSAQEAYNQILREGAPAGSPPAFAKAVEEAQRELDALAPRVPSVTIQVRGPAAPQILLDGEPVPQAALGIPRPVDPGRHVLRARTDGFDPAEVAFVSVEGKGQAVVLDLHPLANGAPRAPAAPSGGPASGVSPAAEDPAASRRVAGIATLSVGGALIVTGAVMLALDLATACDPNTDINLCMPPPPRPPYDIMAGVFFGAGAASATAGIVLLATLPKAARAAPAAPVALVPVIGPGYVGVRGRF